MNNLEKVKEFQLMTKSPVLQKPQLINKERALLRIALIEEELNELKEAVNNDDLIEIADALVDIEYVTQGAYIEFGFTNIASELFDEVHRSNMSKACISLNEANCTIDVYMQKDGLERSNYSIEKLPDSENLIVNRNGKILKSINYSPANLKKIIKKNV